MADALPGPLTDESPIWMNRTALYHGNVDKNWSVAYSRRNLTGALTLVDVGLNEFTPTEIAIGVSVVTGGDGGLRRGFVLPAGLASGTYTYKIGTRTAGTVTVSPAPVNADPRRLWPSSDGQVARANAYMVQGYDVMLMPGRYHITTPFVMQADRTLYGNKAVISSDTLSYLLQPANGCTLKGLEFRGLRDDAQGAFSTTAASNVTVKDCAFTGMIVNYNGALAGSLFESCEFDRSAFYAGAGTGGMSLYRCRWNGVYGHALVLGGSDKIAVVDCEFADTDRGIVVQNTVADCYLSSLTFRGQDRVNNGSTCFESEGNVTMVSRLVLTQWRATGCAGGIQWWSTSAEDNLIYNYRDNGQGIMFHAGNPLISPAVVQSGNHVLEGELQGASVQIFTDARYNLIENVACINWRPTNGNRFNGQEAYYVIPSTAQKDSTPYGYQQPSAVIGAWGTDKATNVARNCTVYNQPSGFPATTGVTVE